VKAVVLLAVAVTIVVAIALAALCDSRAKRHGWKVGASAVNAGRYRSAPADAARVTEMIGSGNAPRVGRLDAMATATE
jgi:hypothetical protein